MSCHAGDTDSRKEPDTAAEGVSGPAGASDGSAQRHRPILPSMPSSTASLPRLRRASEGR